MEVRLHVDVWAGRSALVRATPPRRCAAATCASVKAVR